MLIPTRNQAGVTLVELLIAVALLTILLSLGVPSFRLWMQNSQIRTAADGLINGVQLARAEAIRRNKPVEFLLRDGSNWSVVLARPPRTTLQERKGNEGSKTTTVSTEPGGTDRVTFNPTGAPSGSSLDGSLRIDRININGSQGLAGTRPLRIEISVSGSVRLCDPDPNLPVGDPRRCSM